VAVAYAFVAVPMIAVPAGFATDAIAADRIAFLGGGATLDFRWLYVFLTRRTYEIVSA